MSAKMAFLGECIVRTHSVQLQERRRQQFQQRAISWASFSCMVHTAAKCFGNTPMPGKRSRSKPTLPSFFLSELTAGQHRTTSTVKKMMMLQL